MAKRPDHGPSGFLVVDKPRGWTSHDVVDAARRWLGTRRVGHLGTLDPLATGVLPLAVREATKLVPFVEGGRKRYRALLALGAETDTLDADGRVTATAEGALPEPAEVEAALAGFLGPQQQVPPMYSAVKRGGVPLHRLARRGEEVARSARPVTIHALRCLRYEGRELELDVECSPGTYVRVLAADLGRRLGCLAHVAALRRLASGPFALEHASEVPELDALPPAGVAARLVPPVAVLGWPTLRLEPGELRRVRHGGEIRPVGAPALGAAPGARFAATDEAGTLVAVLELRPDRALHPLRVLQAGPEAALPPGS